MTSQVAEAVASLGGATSVARLRGLTPWAVSKWVRDGVPPTQVLWLSEQTGWRFTPHELAPDIYPNADDGLPHDKRVAMMMEQHPERAA
jgi:DNA-binding transcriptional regulator YdaS (Cro superfamily)